ncbi:MAG: hypothetical protein Kow0099_28320 [Candidatus Abyssubacteria bacterium]
MKRRHAGFLTTIGLLLLVTASAGAAESPAPFSPKATASVHMPFIKNEGQIGNEQVAYYAETFGGTVYVTEDGAIFYSLPGMGEHNAKKVLVLQERLIGALDTQIKGENTSSTIINYFKGDEPSRWKKNISAYEAVQMGEVYEGVQLKLKAHGNNVEKFFVLEPGADPGKIRIMVGGGTTLSTNADGQLVVATELGDVRFTRPVAYQMTEDGTQSVDVAYSLDGMEYGFSVGAYDKTRELVIDPLLASTVVGGGGDESVRGIGADGSGNIYVAGYQSSSTFPTTPGCHDSVINGMDGFVTKMDANLSTVLASTYIGGSNNDYILALESDPSGLVCVAGYTYSYDFPTPNGAFTTNNSSPGGSEVCVALLEGSTMVLLAGTYLGGVTGFDGNMGASEHVSVSLGKYGGVYVAGSTNSIDFPTTPGAYIEDETEIHPTSSGYNVFISKFSNTLSSLEASTLLGGSGGDYLLDVDAKDGPIYVTGGTYSIDLPITNGTPKVGWLEAGAFLGELTMDLDVLNDLTYLDGSADDWAFDIGIWGSSVYIVGYTASSDIPIHWTGQWDNTPNGSWDVFLARFNASDLEYTAFTYIGGAGADYARGMVSSANGFTIVGYTASTDFPTTPGVYRETSKGEYEVFVTNIDASLEAVAPSTYIGGTSYDYGRAITMASGCVYITGETSSFWSPPIAYPTLPEGAVYDELWGFPTGRGSSEVFISKFDAALSFGPPDVPELVIEPSATIDFGDVLIGYPETRWFKVVNYGRDYLTIQDVGVDDPLAPPFSITQDYATGESIQPNRPAYYRLVYMQFDPQTEGPFTDTLNVRSNDPDDPKVTITLTGNAGLPQEPVISVTPMSHDFGSVTVGESSPAQQITISNIGIVALNIWSTPTLSDATNYTLNPNGGTNPLGTGWKTVPPGEFRTVTVAFNPQSAAVHAATLTIDHDDYARGSPTVVSFTGTGAVVAIPDISVSPLSHDFGDVIVGQSSTPLTVEVTNTGNADLSVTGMTLSDSTNYLLTGNTAATIPPAGSHTVSVTFSPLSSGAHPATLTIDSNDPDEPGVGVSLGGDGLVLPAIALTPTSLNNACDMGNDAASQSFEVWNSGEGTLTYTISDDADWLSCTPSSGDSTGEHDIIAVDYATASLAADTYSATITVSAPGATNDPQTISVSLTVHPVVVFGQQVGVYRSGVWYLDTNQNRELDAADMSFTMGQSTDRPLVGDWDGDRYDECGFRRDVYWVEDLNSDYQLSQGDTLFRGGLPGDTPVVGDWNDDGAIEEGIFIRGLWYLDLNGDRQFSIPGGDGQYTFGAAGDIPLVGDWDGDGSVDLGVFRIIWRGGTGFGVWFLDMNGTHSFDAGDTVCVYGQAGDIPIRCDSNGDGTDEIGVFRNGVWIIDSDGNREMTLSDLIFTYGAAGDVPVVGSWELP